MTPPPRPMGTRELLVCAGVGVVCGLVMLPAVYLQVTVTATAPVLYTAATGVFLLAPVLAQALVRRPGAALIAAVVAALAGAPASPRGILAVGPMALVGLVFEAAARTGRYRTWPRWRWHLAALALSCFSMVTVTLAFDLLNLRPALAVASIAAIPASYLLATGLAVAIAERIDAAGLGLRAPGGDAAGPPPATGAEGDAPR